MNAVSCFAKGWRTLTAAAALVVTGLLSVFGQLDLTPLVALFVKDPAYLGVAMLGVGALFGWLRYITSTGICKKDHAEDFASIDAIDSARAKTDEGQ